MDPIIFESDFICVEWIPKEHLLISRFKSTKNEFNYEEYLHVIEGVKSVLGDQHFLSMADIRHAFFTMDKEAQKLAANHKWMKKFKIAEAVITDSLAIKIALDFYLKVFRPKPVTRGFSNEEDAILWLHKEWKKFTENC